MSVRALKQAISGLDKRRRSEIHAHLVRLQRDSPAWKREAARRIRDMQSGKGLTTEQLEARLAGS